MIVLIVTRVTRALRGELSRWLFEVHAGVFVGSVSSSVRDRLWAMVEGRKRLGACTLIVRAPLEPGFTFRTSGDPRRRVIDSDGLALVRVGKEKRLSGRAQAKPVAAENPSEEGCGGDPSSRGPDEAAKRGGDAPHPERTVLPNEEAR